MLGLVARDGRVDGVSTEGAAGLTADHDRRAGPVGRQQ